MDRWRCWRCICPTRSASDKWGITLAGIFSGVLYWLPILAGTFVDRYGFRRCLMACFAMFSLGYMAIALAGMPAGAGLLLALGKGPYVCTVLLFTAVGAR